MPSLYDPDPISGNVAPGNNTSLYPGTITPQPTNAEALLALLSNNGDVQFALDPASGNLKVLGDVDIPAGTVELVGAVTGTGNTGSPITTTITSTGVTPNTYGSSTQIPQITVNAAGQITDVTLVTGTGNYTDANVAAYMPTYTGTLSNSSTIIGIQSTLTGKANLTGATFTGNISAPYITANGSLLTGLTAGQISGLATVATTGDYDDLTDKPTIPSSVVTLTGDVTGSGNTGSSISTTLADNGVISGIYGSGVFVPKITVDSTGRITDVENVGISASGTLPAGGQAGQQLVKASNLDYDTIWGDSVPAYQYSFNKTLTDAGGPDYDIGADEFAWIADGSDIYLVVGLSTAVAASNWLAVFGSTGAFDVKPGTIRLDWNNSGGSPTVGSMIVPTIGGYQIVATPSQPTTAVGYKILVDYNTWLGAQYYGINGDIITFSYDVQGAGAVDSVNGQTGAVVLDTDNIDEGTTNLYWTTARGDQNFTDNLATITTDNLTQGSVNLYYTDAAARAAISGTGAITYDSGTGVISYNKTPFNWRGNFDIYGTYAVGDAVYYGGSSWICVQATGPTPNYPTPFPPYQTYPPADNAYWDYLAQVGATGATGAVGGVPYIFSILTSGDPGAGKLRFDNSTYSSVSNILFDSFSVIANVGGWIESFDDSTSTDKGYITVRAANGGNKLAIFMVNGPVTDNTGYYTVPVSYVSGFGTFSEQENIAVDFSATGDLGQTGAAGPGVAAGGTAGQILAKIDGTDYNTEWVDPTGAVDSVNGQTGVVVLDTDDISEGTTNLYYTDTRANAAIDARVTKTFVDALDVDAGTLDGIDSTGFATAAQGVPAGGTTAQVLGKVDGTDYNTDWIDVATAAQGLPAGGATNDVLVKQSGTDYDATWTDVITIDGVQLDTAAAEAAAVGKMVWDAGEGTITFQADVGTDVNIGQSEFIKVKNDTGGPLTKGQVVYVTGAQGNRPTVDLAIATGDSTSAQTLGVVAEALADGAEGMVMTYGVLKNVNTVGFTDGQLVFLSPTTAGAWTATKPYAPDHMVYVGYVITGGVSNGRLFVKIQNGYELDELHDVNIGHINAKTDNDHLVYDAAQNLWINEQLDISQDTTPTLGGTLDTAGNTLANVQIISGDGVNNISLAGNGLAIKLDGEPIDFNGEYVWNGADSIIYSGSFPSGNNIIRQATNLTGTGWPNSSPYIGRAAGLSAVDWLSTPTSSTATRFGAVVGGVIGSIDLKSAQSDTLSRGPSVYKIGGQVQPDVDYMTANNITRLYDNDRFRTLEIGLDVNPRSYVWGSVNEASQNYGKNGWSRDTLTGVYAQITPINNGTLTSVVPMSASTDIRPVDGDLNIFGITGQSVRVGFSGQSGNATRNSTVEWAAGLRMSTYRSGFTGGTQNINNIALVYIDNGINTATTNRYSIYSENSTVSMRHDGPVDIAGDTTLGSLKSYTEKITDLGTTSGTLTMSASTSPVYKAVINGAITINAAGLTMSAGQSLTVKIKQDGTGGHTLTTDLKFAGGSKTLSTDPNAIDIINIFYDGDDYMASLVKGYA